MALLVLSTVIWTTLKWGSGGIIFINERGGRFVTPTERRGKLLVGEAAVKGQTEIREMLWEKTLETLGPLPRSVGGLAEVIECTLYNTLETVQLSGVEIDPRIAAPPGAEVLFRRAYEEYKQWTATGGPKDEFNLFARGPRLFQSMLLQIPDLPDAPVGLNVSLIFPQTLSGQNITGVLRTNLAIPVKYGVDRYKIEEYSTQHPVSVRLPSREAFVTAAGHTSTEMLAFLVWSVFLGPPSLFLFLGALRRIGRRSNGPPLRGTYELWSGPLS